MISSREFLYLNLGLAAVSAVWAVQLVSIFSAPVAPPATPGRTGAAREAALVPPDPSTDPPSLASYAPIGDGNLFSPERGRRGPPAPPASGSLPALHGVVLADDGGSIAFLRDPATRAIRRYRTGDRVGDMTVDAIRADRVVLRGEGPVEIRLRDRGLVAPDASAAAPGEAHEAPPGREAVAEPQDAPLSEPTDGESAALSLRPRLPPRRPLE